MFTILGGDGKEYGPVTAEQIRAWITAGRANLETQAKVAGSTDGWRRLGDVPEFTGVGLPPPLGDPMTAAVVPTQKVEPAVESASLGKRFGAAVIDGFLVWLCRIPAMVAIFQAFYTEFSSGQQPSAMALITTANEAMAKSYPYIAALVIIQGVLIGLRSQSVGKVVFRLVIVRADGTKAGFARAFLLRGVVVGLIEQIPLLGGLFWLADCCFIFGEERRCLHDYMAGTKVTNLSVVSP